MRLSRCLSALALSLLLLCSFLAPDFETDGDPAAFEAGQAQAMLASSSGERVEAAVLTGASPVIRTSRANVRLSERQIHWPALAACLLVYVSRIVFWRTRALIIFHTVSLAAHPCLAPPSL